MAWVILSLEEEDVCSPTEERADELLSSAQSLLKMAGVFRLDVEAFLQKLLIDLKDVT